MSRSVMDKLQGITAERLSTARTTAWKTSKIEDENQRGKAC